MIVLVAALLAAGPAPKLALPGLDRVDVEPQKADFFSEYLAQELFDAGYQVVTRKQIEAVLGLERQRALLGCTDSSSASCLAELAGALGAELILVGSVARLDDQYVFTLKIVSAKDATTIAQRRGGGKTDKDALDWLARAGRALAESAAPPGPRGGSTLRTFSWAPLIGAAGAGIGSLILFSGSQNSASMLREGRLHSQGDAEAVAASGSQQQVISAVLLGVAVAFVAVAALMYLFGGGP